MENKVLSCYCTKCKHATNHDVLFLEKDTSEDEEYWWKEIYPVADEELRNHTVGDIDILRNLLASDRRFRKEDLRGF